MRRLTQSHRRAGPQAVLTQVQLKEGVGGWRLGQNLRPFVEQVIVAHQQRVQKRRLPLQQGGQADGAKVIVADVQVPQAGEEFRLLRERRAPAKGISHRSSRRVLSSLRQSAPAR